MLTSSPSDGHLLKSFVVHNATTFKQSIIMPNLKLLITNVVIAIAYQERIDNDLPSNNNITPLIILYVTDNTYPNEIKLTKVETFLV